MQGRPEQGVFDNPLRHLTPAQFMALGGNAVVYVRPIKGKKLSEFMTEAEFDESEADDTFKRVLGMKLDAMLGLCETLHCRRTRLLEYFGERSTPCGNCDTCLIPPVSFDGTVPVQNTDVDMMFSRNGSLIGHNFQLTVDVARTRYVRRNGFDPLLFVRRFHRPAQRHLAIARNNLYVLTIRRQPVIRGDRLSDFLSERSVCFVF